MMLDDRFYRQVLGLMIKLKLAPPFDLDNPNDCPEDFFFSKAKRSYQVISEEEDKDEEIDIPVKLSGTHPHHSVLNKRVKLSTGIVGEKAKNYVNKPKTTSKDVTTTVEELFECKTLNISKRPHHKIELNWLDVNSSVLPAQSEEQTSESFGLICPKSNEEKNKKVQRNSNENKHSILAEIKETDLVSDLELMQNQITESQRNNWPAFKNYESGNSSQRLYIKNLHEKVTQLDLYRIFLKFIQLPDHLDSFDIVYMKKGRLRGQAFVTFPSIDIAEKALQSTNGYMLKSKPMVVVSKHSNCL